MKIAVVGTGYVGLTTGTCLAEKGHEVTCVDTDGAKIACLQRGECPIYERDLESMIRRNMARGRLHFGTDLALVNGNELVFLAVGTPEGLDGTPDMEYVMTATRACAPHLDEDAVLVIKSTVPPTAYRDVAKWAEEARAAAGQTSPIHVAVNPEFLKQGSAVDDTMHPARVIVGVEDADSKAKLLDLYADWSVPMVVTDPVSAMLVKYSSNCFLAAKISFINEIANLCDAIGGHIDDVALGMGLDPRIGPKFLQAGIGYGGSCFPKDTVGLLWVAREAGVDLRVLDATREVNERQVARVVARLKDLLGSLNGQTIAVFGLAFKSGTDDLRESRGIALANLLVAAGAQVVAYDPIVYSKKRAISIAVVEDVVTAARGASAIVVATDDQGMNQLDWVAIAAAMTGKLVLDGRNVLDRTAVEEAGLEYVGIGRHGCHHGYCA
jgi:UDPglucose 6-dehydrogenase